MRTTDYYTPIDWRRVQFGLTHPDVLPYDLHTRAIPENALFLPSEEISNPRDVRDWLHDRAQTNGRYNLLGYYSVERLQYQVRSVFRGIIIVFHQVVDAVHFRLAWNTLLLPLS